MNRERQRLRYLRDPLAIRLGELAVTFGRISSTLRVISNPEIIGDALEEAKYMIEWTAAETEPEVAAELVSMQTQINLWLGAWDHASQHREQRTLLSVQAKHWSDRALDFSGLRE